MKSFFYSCFGMFLGADGIVSWSKLQSFCSFIVAAVLAIAGMYTQGGDHVINASNVVPLIGTFLASAAGLSAYGKFINNKHALPEDKLKSE